MPRSMWSADVSFVPREAIQLKGAKSGLMLRGNLRSPDLGSESVPGFGGWGRRSVLVLVTSQLMVWVAHPPAVNGPQFGRAARRR
jgi:hypothetical protein